eukprot:9491036-Pyramimonas_sp.AAC.2
MGCRTESRCPFTRQDAADDCSCSMDFNLLFDEAVGPLSTTERSSRRDTGGTYVYLRVLKRMCIPEDDHMREVSFCRCSAPTLTPHTTAMVSGRPIVFRTAQGTDSSVLDVAREALRPLTIEQYKLRDLVIETVYTALYEEGYNPLAVTSGRTYGAGGVMCPQHTCKLELFDPYFACNIRGGRCGSQSIGSLTRDRVWRLLCALRVPTQSIPNRDRRAASPRCISDRSVHRAISASAGGRAIGFRGNTICTHGSR